MGRSVAADEILLADVGAGFAQDVVGGGAVEEHVGQHEVQQVGLAFEVHLAAAHLQVDGAGLAAVDLLGGEALHVGDRTLDAVVHLGESGLVVLERGRFHAGQAGHAAGRHVAGDLHLPHQRQHVRHQSGLQQGDVFHLLGLGVRMALLQYGRKISQGAHGDGNGSLIHRQRHGCCSVVTGEEVSFAAMCSAAAWAAWAGSAGAAPEGSSWPPRVARTATSRAPASSPAASRNAAPGTCKRLAGAIDQANTWANRYGPKMPAKLPSEVLAPCRRPCSDGSTWRVMIDWIGGLDSPHSAISGMPSRNIQPSVAKPISANEAMPQSMPNSSTGRSPKRGVSRRVSSACTKPSQAPTSISTRPTDWVPQW